MFYLSPAFLSVSPALGGTPWATPGDSPLPGAFSLSSLCLVKHLGDFEAFQDFKAIFSHPAGAIYCWIWALTEEDFRGGAGGSCLLLSTGRGPFCVILKAHTELQHRLPLCTHRKPNTHWDRSWNAA